MNWEPIIEFFGGAAAITGLIGYLGKKAIDNYAAGRVATLKNELELLSDERRDALTRKRDVYARVANSMRVFLKGSAPATEDQKDKFTAAFDESFLWASEEVAKALIDFLQLSIKQSADPGAVTNDEFKNSYRACLIAMRRDCGFLDTELKYPVASFK